jgi:hypothetical protein
VWWAIDGCGYENQSDALAAEASANVTVRMVEVVVPSLVAVHDGSVTEEQVTIYNQRRE